MSARRVRVPLLPGGEARALDEVRAPDRAGEPRPALVLGDDDELEPAPVGGAVEVVQGARRVLAPRPPRKLRPAQHRLRVQAVPPQPVRHQVGGDVAAPSGAFAPEEGGGDGRIEGERGRVVAHAGERLRGRRVRRGPDHVHQPAPRPERGAVEAGVEPLRAAFAVGGEGGVDQPLVVRPEVLVADPEPPARGERDVGDEDVRIPDEPVEGAPARLGLEVEHQPPLVPVVHEPPVVHLAGWISGSVAQMPERIAGGRLELDDVGPELRHHGGRGRSGDEAARVDDLEPGEWWSVVHVPGSAAGAGGGRGRGRWWSRGGSNSRPSHCERDALPSELRPRADGILP